MNTFNAIDSRYKGVKGWLLLLCVNLMILDPCSILFSLFVVTNATKPHFDQYPGLLKLMFINGACSIGLTVFSIYAGISLLKILPNAVKTAKKYLSTAFMYSIISIFLPALVGLPEKAYNDITGNTLFNSLITMLYLALWYQYLKKSRRVMATYGEVQYEA